MFTSKRQSNAKKKSRPQPPKPTQQSQLDAFAKAARLEYDELAKQKSRATSAKKIADLEERMSVHVDVSEVNAMLKFHSDPVIANNVTFGKIISTGDSNATQYGFTCKISKRGDTTVIPVCTEHPDLLCRLGNAKSMVMNGTLTRAYKTASRNFIAAEMERMKKEQTNNIMSVLEAAVSVGDDADAMISEASALQALIAAFERV